MASSSSDDEKVYVDDRYVDAMEMYRNAQKDFTELLKELRKKLSEEDSALKAAASQGSDSKDQKPAPGQ